MSLLTQESHGDYRDQPGFGLSGHAPDIVMFDVPPRQGIDGGNTYGVK